MAAMAQESEAVSSTASHDGWATNTKSPYEPASHTPSAAVLSHKASEPWRATPARSKKAAISASSSSRNRVRGAKAMATEPSDYSKSDCLAPHSDDSRCICVIGFPRVDDKPR